MAPAIAMKQLTFWFDPVSPFAALAFERLPQTLAGLSVTVAYRPVLFAGLLKRWGQKGPAEIEPKRAWTFRQVHWLAHQQGMRLATPAQHPFNPLPLLRLLLACAPAGGTPSRRCCEAVLQHVWQDGADANDPQRLAALTRELAPQADPAGPAVKQALKDATDAAIAIGLFGVPTVEVDGRLFWGLDGLPMLAGYLHGDPWFDGPGWEREGAPRLGVVRPG
jgi:2-hydroxychromene-2-carboxylate isomerase